MAVPKFITNDMKGGYVGGPTTPARRCYVGGTLVYQGFGPASEQEFIQQEAAGGPAQLLKVYGKTIVNNQLVNITNGTITVAGVTFTTANGEIALSGIVSGNYTYDIQHANVVIGHKYLLKGCPPSGSLTTYNIRYSTNGNGETGAGVIVTASSSMLNTLSIFLASGIDTAGLVFDPRLIDLTLRFGAGNEPTSVDEALRLLGGDAFDPTYDAGSLQSNKTAELRAYDGDTLRGSLALNLSTLTGKLNGEGESVVVYPDGMCGVRDVRSEAYGSTGINKFYAIVFDGTEASWRTIGSLTFATGNIFSQAPVPNLYLRGNRGNGKASHFGLNTPSGGVADTGNWDITDAGTNFGMTFNRELVPSVSTLADWKAWLAAQYAAGTPLVVVYEVATPLTYTLDTTLPTDLTCEQGDILQRVSGNNCPFVGEMRFGL